MAVLSPGCPEGSCFTWTALDSLLLTPRLGLLSCVPDPAFSRTGRVSGQCTGFPDWTGLQPPLRAGRGESGAVLHGQGGAARPRPGLAPDGPSGALGAGSGESRASSGSRKGAPGARLGNHTAVRTAWLSSWLPPPGCGDGSVRRALKTAFVSEGARREWGRSPKSGAGPAAPTLPALADTSFPWFMSHVPLASLLLFVTFDCFCFSNEVNKVHNYKRAALKYL